MCTLYIANVKLMMSVGCFSCEELSPMYCMYAEWTCGRAAQSLLPLP